MPRLPIEGLVEKKPYGRLKTVLVILALVGVGFGIFVATRPRVAGPQAANGKHGPSERSVLRRDIFPDAGDRRQGLPAVSTTVPSRPAHIRPSPFSAGIWKRIEALDPRLRQWRRELHRHPEPSNRETWTADFLAGHLDALKVPVRRIPGSTGLVATIEGGPGPVVALVAGMDGLPVREARDRPYASSRRFVFHGKKVWMSHAGGRDVEMAVLLGVAEVLTSLGDRLPGRVLLVFQPASEGTPPGELPGGQALVRSGIFARSSVGALFWMSSRPDIRVGRVALPEQQWWKGMTSLHVLVSAGARQSCSGRAGGSGGCSDPVLAASQLLINLQAQMGRQGNEAVQLTVHRVRAEGPVGRTAGRVVIDGVLRWRNDVARRQGLSLVRRVSQGIMVSSRVAVRIEPRILGRSLPSDPGLARWALPTLRRSLGDGGVIDASVGSPGVGFDRYRRVVPSLALGLGTHSSKLKRVRHLGTSDFDVDEECLSVGVHVLANLALDFLLDQRRSHAGRLTVARPGAHSEKESGLRRRARKARRHR